jgi:hypothetical protein
LRNGAPVEEMARSDAVSWRPYRPDDGPDNARIDGHHGRLTTHPKVGMARSDNARERYRKLSRGGRIDRTTARTTPAV